MYLLSIPRKLSLAAAPSTAVYGPSRNDEEGTRGPQPPRQDRYPSSQRSPQRPLVGSSFNPTGERGQNENELQLYRRLLLCLR